MTENKKDIIDRMLQSFTMFRHVNLSKEQLAELYIRGSQWGSHIFIEGEITAYLLQHGYECVDGFYLPYNMINPTKAPKDKDTDLMTLELFLKFDGTFTPYERQKIVDKLFMNLKTIYDNMGFIPNLDEGEQITQAFTLTNVENEYSRGWDCSNNMEI